VAVMCRVMEVSKSGYYDWVDRPESNRSKRHRYLTAKIRQAHLESRKTYGAPRIHRDLIGQGERVSKYTVVYLMRKDRIQSKVHKRFVMTTDSRRTKKPVQNILGEHLNQTKRTRNGYQMLPLYRRGRSGCFWLRLWILIPG
jgi:putative transposase